MVVLETERVLSYVPQSINTISSGNSLENGSKCKTWSWSLTKCWTLTIFADHAHFKFLTNISIITTIILPIAISEIDDYDFDARKVLSGGVYPSTETVEDKASQTDESFPLISIDEAETFHHQFDDPIYAEDLEKIYIEKINGMEFTKEFTVI